jgi:hypothetical protein
LNTGSDDSSVQLRLGDAGGDWAGVVAGAVLGDVGDVAWFVFELHAAPRMVKAATAITARTRTPAPFVLTRAHIIDG